MEVSVDFSGADKLEITFFPFIIIIIALGFAKRQIVFKFDLLVLFTSYGSCCCLFTDMRMSTSMYEIFDRGNSNNSVTAQTSSASNVIGTERFNNFASSTVPLDCLMFNYFFFIFYFT